MKSLFVLMLFLPVATWADCQFESSENLIEGKPIVHVAPIYPKRLLRKGIEGCVVLGYSLSYKSETDKRGAYVSNPQVLHSSAPGSKQFEKAAKRAASKWLFNPKTHPVSNDITHYSVIAFELAD